MEEGRILTSKITNKPRVILENERHKFLKELSVGDKGQVGCALEVEGIELEMDFDGNERKVMRVSLHNLELIDDRGIRL